MVGALSNTASGTGTETALARSYAGIERVATGALQIVDTRERWVSVSRACELNVQSNLFYADNKIMGTTSRPRTSAQGTETTAPASPDRKVLKTPRMFVLLRAASSLSPHWLSGRRLAAMRSHGLLAALLVLGCAGAVAFGYGWTN